MRGRRVLVTGAEGFVGNNLLPILRRTECTLIPVTRRQYDLVQQDAVRKMFADHRPEVVFHLAGLVGGILANKNFPADYNYQNLMMGTMMLHEARQAGVEKYITLMGGCSYPAHAQNPIKETALWNGYPQGESAPYSLAKAMSAVQAQAYRQQFGFNAIVLVPGNLYGPHDNFDLQNSHVIPALIRKYHEVSQTGQTEITAWGSGRPIRDFIYVEDACEAIVKAAEIYDAGEIINISSGVQTTIKELVETIAAIVGFTGTITWDTTKPDGQMLKGFDVTRMREWLKFECKIALSEGIKKTFAWYAANHASARVTSPSA